jgi:hypothetical protein
LFEDRATESCFARAHLACDLDEPLPVTNPVKQMIESFAVLGAEKKKTRVGRNVEWRFF